MQIDTTPLDVLVILEDGVSGRPELTIAVDVATRTICAAVLRPAGTKAVDASLLLVEILAPEPLRPGWPEALALSATLIPHARLLDIDARLEQAAAKPVIVPETIGIDHGKVFVSDVFIAACRSLGVSVQPSRPATPTDKAIVERTFSSINTLFCQHVSGYGVLQGSTDRPPHTIRHREYPHDPWRRHDGPQTHRAQPAAWKAPPEPFGPGGALGCVQGSSRSPRT
ncbi:hypothetical protein [Streptomyces anulatus]|uniref:hypothetical protein n=1 Tax=Streptomyces anulatus TaxID=1892 RepID=UPI003F4D5A17